MKLLSFFSILIIGLSQPLDAQTDVQKIDQYLSAARADWNIPGMSVAIVKDGEILLSKGYGVTEAGTNKPVDENTLFAIASNTKAFVSAAISKLVAEGELSWDDKVKTYIPEFELYDDYVSNNATIRDLLCHRLGLGTFSGDNMWYKSTLNVPELITRLKYLEQAYPFRSGYGYSNLMFITAGEVITRVAKKPWTDYVKESFFTPLEMNRTITSTGELDSKGNYAMPHKPYEDGNAVIPWVNWDNMGAAGGIISSANDMSNWMMMHLNKGLYGSDTILHRNQQNVMWTIHNSHVISDKGKEQIPGRHFSGYGLGWGLGDYHGNMLVTHSGGYDGMYSRVMLVPDQNLGIAILTNSMKGISTPLCFYIVNQFIKKDQRDWSAEWLEKSNTSSSEPSKIDQIKAAKVKKSKPTLSLESYAGRYWSGMHGDVTITQTGKDKLRLEFESAPALSATLRHWHYDAWEIIWDETHAWFDFGLVQFQLDEKLDVTGLSFSVPNYDIFFDEVDLKRVK